jgi:hypothetical protein
VFVCHHRQARWAPDFGHDHRFAAQRNVGPLLQVGGGPLAVGSRNCKSVAGVAGVSKNAVARRILAWSLNMDATTAIPQPGSSTTPRRPLRILHISDIHIGYRFNPSKWNNLCRAAESLQPDFGVLTGDLVNTPWRWLLPRVRKHLDQLAERLGDQGQRCPIHVIAGNHDTRISGLLPIPWLTWIGAALALAAAAMGVYVQPYASIVPALLAVVVFGLRLATVPDMARALGAPYSLEAPLETPCGRVGLLPLDSASHPLSWARGAITPASLARIEAKRAQIEAQAGQRVWIALVHHHPLPLPYDSEHESMMVMDNAGALLHHLTSLKIRLVLHGHKHHQHFARISIKPATSPYAELAVLSAGTPTEGRSAGPRWHGFNVIEIDERLGVHITPWHAQPQGGAFEAGECFPLVPPERRMHQRYLDSCDRMPLLCSRLLCSADISAFGHGRVVREFRGVRARNGPVSQMQLPAIGYATHGIVESLTARQLSGGPQVVVRAVRLAPNRIEAQVGFFPDLEGDQTYDFATEFHAMNFFALNCWQHRTIYQNQDATQEYLRTRTPPDMALNELVMHLRFPGAAVFPRQFMLRTHPVPDGSDSAQHRGAWRVLPITSIVVVQSQSEVFAHITHPEIDALYELRWTLEPDAVSGSTPTRERAINRALDLRERLVQHAPRCQEQLKALLQRTRQAAAASLGNGTADYGIALFGYDAQLRALCCVASNFRPDDARSAAQYGFGLGPVGSAFKSGSVVAFSRPTGDPQMQPYYYVQPNGLPVLQRSDVPEFAMLAIPVAPPDASDWVFAVLQLSTDDAKAVLTTSDTATDSSVRDFVNAVNRTFLEELEQVFASNSDYHPLTQGV